MGDMGDFFREEKEEFKLRCERRNNQFEPMLIALGAIKKSDAVYELNGWFCYPTKGFAMRKNNPSQRMALNVFIKDRTRNETNR